MSTYKTTITPSEQLSLIGLGAVAGSLNRQLKEVEKAAAQIVGARDDGHGYFGLASDFVFNATGDAAEATTLVASLGLKVKVTEE
jgi:hypothetical protein